MVRFRAGVQTQNMTLLVRSRCYPGVGYCIELCQASLFWPNLCYAPPCYTPQCIATHSTLTIPYMPCHAIVYHTKYLLQHNHSMIAVPSIFAEPGVADIVLDYKPFDSEKGYRHTMSQTLV